ncbi:GVQW3 protein, partial [Acromyrmex charruanus]
MEQRAAIKFCFKLKKTPSETLELLQTAYGNECLSRSKVFEWWRGSRRGEADQNSGGEESNGGKVLDGGKILGEDQFRRSFKVKPIKSQRCVSEETLKGVRQL